jgi:tetratricopeptide (TPR) repeat protein
VHLYDPHAPYTPPAEFLQRAAGNAYDGEVAYADAQVARLLDGLRSAGQLERTVIVIAGDHGESLGEHGERTHGMLAYESALRVPLIVAGPGIVPAWRTDPVSIIDVAPTLLARAGLEPGIAGARDLLATAEPDREIYAETQYPRVAGWSPVYVLVQDRWKLIVSRGSELYDITADAVEQHNLAGARGSTAAAMSARIDVLRKSTAHPTPANITPDVTERLRALGYVAGSAAPATPGAGPNPADHIAAWGEFEDALADLSSGNRPRALARLQALAAAHPDAPVLQSTYARVLAESGSRRAALTIYRRAVARWPTDATLFHELAVTARDAGEAGEAMRAEEAALALDPALPSAHNGRGLLLTDASRHDDAVLAFERAVEGDPTNASYWVNLGNARRAGGDMARAADAYRQAAVVDPRSPDAANGLGVLLVQQKRANDAIALFERAIDVSPAFTEARLNLGIAYQQSGQPSRAIEAYRDVLARARPGSPERRAATDLLRSLGQ